MENCCNGNGEITQGVRLQNVCSDTDAHGTLHNFNVIVLSKENDPATRGEPQYSLRSFETVQNGHSDIEQGNIRTILGGLLHRFLSVACLTNDQPFWPVLKNRTDDTSPLTEIIGHKNPDLTSWGSYIFHLSKSLPQYDTPITWRATGDQFQHSPLLAIKFKISGSSPRYFAPKVSKKLSALRPMAVELIQPRFRLFCWAGPN